MGDERWGMGDLASRIYIDPMIGFGTTREEDLELLRSVPELAKKARVLVGASRKRLVKKLTGEKVTGKNLGGNLGIAVWAAMNGASVVRVHDVRETFQALKVIGAICGRICG
jgi:dihydropteroate synthase